LARWETVTSPDVSVDDLIDRQGAVPADGVPQVVGQRRAVDEVVDRHVRGGHRLPPRQVSVGIRWRNGAPELSGLVG
jgi:hypothetical protein